MGDRGNIIIEKDAEMFPAPVFFYTHWSGSDMRGILQSALIKGKSRWHDPQYLSRVIFCELVKGDEGVTGFGITTRIGDNEHDFLCVNMQENKVRVRGKNEGLEAKPFEEWTFEQFCAEKF